MTPVPRRLSLFPLAAGFIAREQFFALQQNQQVSHDCVFAGNSYMLYSFARGPGGLLHAFPVPDDLTGIPALDCLCGGLLRPRKRHLSQQFHRLFAPFPKAWCSKPKAKSNGINRGFLLIPWNQLFPQQAGSDRTRCRLGWHPFLYLPEEMHVATQREGWPDVAAGWNRSAADEVVRENPHG